MVDCALAPSPENAAHASRRLGVILSSYTVYIDLWLCDLSGKVIANGRPDRADVHAFAAHPLVRPSLRGTSGPGARDLTTTVLGTRLTAPVPVRFPPEVMEQIRERAQADDRSVSAWIRRAVEAQLRRPA